MATLKEIAAKAKVHLTTVSSILNPSKGNSRCSEETRIKVQRIAAECGYMRNQLASRLRNRRTNTICLVAGDIRNPFFASLATSIEEELELHGYQLLLLCRGWKEGPVEPAAIQSVFEQPVDGFIVWSESVGKTLQNLPPHFPKPIITIGSPTQGFPGVRLDIEHGLKKAVQYLARKGHRHLAYYAPDESRTKGLPQPRHSLFVKLVKEAGLPIPQLIFYPGTSWDISAAKNHAKNVNLKRGTTALLGYNDVAILGWQNSNADSSVETVSFDGTDWLQLCSTPIPCVKIPASQLAKASVSMMIECLGGTGKIKPAIVQPEFIPV